MITFLVILTLLTGLIAAAYLLGFRLGVDNSREELLRVRLEGAEAQRRIHALTRSAFVAMTEEAERRRGQS